MLLQPNYNGATGQVELIGDTQVDITMTSTVPTALSFCNDLTFQYNHAVSGVQKSECETHFNEQRQEHTLKLRVKPTFGCSSYTSVMLFKPFDRPSGENMWTGYKPSDITVRLKYNWKSRQLHSSLHAWFAWAFSKTFCKPFNPLSHKLTHRVINRNWLVHIKKWKFWWPIRLLLIASLLTNIFRTLIHQLTRLQP